MRLSCFLLLACAALAQDAGTVLSTMVHTTTVRNTSKLSKEKLAQVDPLIASANQARLEGRNGQAMKDFDHALAVLEGKPWTAERSWSDALTMKSEHYVLKQGERLPLTFAQLWMPDEPLSKLPSLEISLIPAFGKGSPEFLKTVGKVNLGPDKQAFRTEVTIPDVADGNYRILGAFEGLGNVSVAVQVRRDFTARFQADEARAAKIPKTIPDLPSAMGYLAKAERANKGLDGDRLARLDLDSNLREAEQMLAAFEKGRNPFANHYGDVERSYFSKVDNTYQPYRLYVPTDYNATSSYPLLILLHGMGGDENTMFDSYGNGAVLKPAEKHSFLVACPKGREPASMYRDSAEQDVMDVLADVERAYKVNKKRVYLAGHSMGAYGTWSIAANHPATFAALAPFSGGGDVRIAEKLKAVPQFVVHGDADPTVAVTQSRSMVEAMKKAGADVQYIEVPGGNHSSVVVPNFEGMFEFFEKHSKN